MSRTQLQASLSLWRRRLAYRQNRVDYVRGDAKAGGHGRTKGVVTTDESARIKKWERLRDEARRMVARRSQQIRDTRPMGERAIQYARTLVGIMEQGGNNVGPRVSEIIRANGGTPGEPWCGDFCAYVYRHVGSKAVTRSWASVRMLRGLVGVIPTSSPAPGALVRFTFDHVGLFEHWCDAAGHRTSQAKATHIKTIEGNTGASGAVSDSSTGGDGVYEKVRSRGLVRDFLTIQK